MSKKIVVLITLVLVVGFGLIWYFFINEGNEDDNTIPGDYIGIFNGGEGETTYSTYVYLLDSDTKGFRYINVTNTTKDKKTTQQVTKKGNVELAEEIFYVATLNIE